MSPRARLVGGRQAAGAFERAAAQLRGDIEDAVRETAADSELIFAAHALRKTGRLSRGVSAKAAGTTAVVTVSAVDPKSGYDYARVTRVGHRGRIVAVNAKALRFPGPGGRPIFRKSVRGFHPARDWAAGALPEIERDAHEVVARIGRSISIRIA
jgi:hypothetical protein